MDALTSNKIRKNIRAVYTSPREDVVRHCVSIVPRNFRGNEGINPRKIEDLRQRRRVSESVWKPYDMAIHPKFLFEEFFTVDNLAD